MYVRQLSLVDFRSWASATVTLEPGPTVLVGPNGSGKTNLVEAVEYVATQASHRVASDVPLVRRSASQAIVRASVIHDGRELFVELEITPGKANRARINRSVLGRAREAIGVLRTVIFAPEHLALIRGDPSERRRFLDELLIMQKPRYASIRADYDRVLKQRNALLKTAGMARRAGELSTLDVWDRHLAHHGAQLLTGRYALVNALHPYVEAAYDEVSQGAGPAIITYSSSVGHALIDEPGDAQLLEAALLAELAKTRDAELARGITLIGPHRDDLICSLGPFTAKGYASHGESWSYALALKLASYELLRSDGPDPVLVLDDVFAELDTTRRDRLAAVGGKAEQVLITAAVPDDVPDQLQGARFDVAAGEVRRVR